MITIQEAINNVKKQNPKLKIVSCKDYNTDFLITAFENEDDMDPFYLVNKKTGSIRNYTIAENPDKYYNTVDLKI